MNDLLDPQDRIERYLLGEMPPDEATQFEADLLRDPQLAAETDTMRRLRQDLRNLDEANFLAEMRQIGQELQPAPTRSNRRWWALAAVILLLLVPTLLLLQPWGGSGSGDLFAEYYSTYPDYTQVRDSEDPNFRSAMDAYNAGDMDAAILSFDAFLSTDPDDLEGQLYAGIAQLEARQAERALELLAPVRSTDNAYSEVAEWYTALAYVQLGRVEDARPRLQVLAGGGEFGEQAAELLDEL